MTATASSMGATPQTVSLLHMVNPSAFGCVYAKGKFCVEGRNRETGGLDFSVKLPFTEATADQLFQHYLRATADDPRASVAQEEVAKWYNDQGIYFRPKTW